MSQSEVRPPRATPPVSAGPPVKRVRDEVKEGMAVASASLMASLALVMVAALLLKFAG